MDHDATTRGTPPPEPPRPSGATGERPGDFVGPYKLLELIGEGGFGTVWLAERREPIVQRIALKILNPGMDSREVLARFEQERQALAVMNHPNVAKVIDAGASASGRPYFAMEHVPGEPITDYCDRHRLTIKERLELFIPVCEAVQHAHHKGIIHRDIKPSNILVAVHEGRAVPKVIDFGVAKAVSHTLTQKTIFTEHGHLIGTPEYMSPEQAEMGATDVDTRTDVYALGVVLYELLSGLLPFDSKTLRAAGFDAVRRIIREQEPPRPSTRLSNLGESGASATGPINPDAPTAERIASVRHTQREQLARELRRELDWIPLKAIRKDRAGRYDTPMDLAQDIGRYLKGEALKAGPESAAYRLRKLVRRKKGLVAALVAVVVVLGAGILSTSVGFYGQVHLRRIAEERERDALASLARLNGLKRAQDFGLRWNFEQGQIQVLINNAWAALADPAASEESLARAVSDSRLALALLPDHEILNTLGIALYRTGSFSEALSSLTDADARRVSKRGATNPRDLAFIAMCHHKLGHADESRVALAKLRELMQDPVHKDDEESKALLREAVELIEAIPAGAK